jgi:hypothetical protein
LTKTKFATDPVKEMEAGTKQQQFNADFLIMTETLDGLLKDLLNSFVVEQPIKTGKTNVNNVVSIAKKVAT